ncbi:MAG: type II toxin-antitoxin system VapC family toxin [Nocardioidaceae bacterium]
MIAVDSSALVAIVLGEPELERFSAIVAREPSVLCAASLVETAMVLESRQGPDSVQELRSVLRSAEVEIHPVTEELAWTAHAAWRRFGRGRHAAGLNYGDCFSYALAKTLSVPLLFKGTDFAQTDIAIAQ